MLNSRSYNFISEWCRRLNCDNASFRFLLWKNNKLVYLVADLFGQKFPISGIAVVQIYLARADPFDHCANETQNCETKDSSLGINFVLEPVDQTQPGSLSLSLALCGRVGEDKLNPESGNIHNSRELQQLTHSLYALDMTLLF